MFSKASKRLAKRVISWLPEGIKYPFIRSIIRFRFKPVIDDDVIVKIADRPEEVEAALGIIDRAYSNVGFHHLGGELDKYQLLPMSTILIALHAGKIVGTLTLVKMNALGLPLERVFTIKDSLKTNEKGAEITRLAIDKGYRRDSGNNVLFPLLKFMYRYAVDYFAVQKIFITCLPRESDFYKALLLFEDIRTNNYVADYLGAPAKAMFLDLLLAPARFNEIYGNSRTAQNLYRYFVDYNSPQLFFPERPFYKTTDAIWNEKSFRYFLSNDGNFKLPPMNEFERRTFQNFYSDVAQAEELFKIATPFTARRLHPRYAYNHLAKICINDADSPRLLELVNVSLAGLCIDGQPVLTQGTKHIFVIHISNARRAQLEVERVWQLAGRSGFKITKADSEWHAYIQYLSGEGQETRLTDVDERTKEVAAAL